MMHDTATELTLTQRLNAASPRYARELAALAYSRGLAVTKTDGGTVPIAIAAAPVVIEETELARRVRLAGLLSSAALKMSRALLMGDAANPPLFDALSPLEASLARATCARLEALAVTRVDFLEGPALGALEINATIPAMQGYSDIARDTFLEVVGRFAGVSSETIDRWRTAGRANARALHQALLAGYAQVRPGRTPARVALLCRRLDAQRTELIYLRDRFRVFGTDADVVHPDQLSEAGDVVSADGKQVDLIYRHIFVRRLEEPGQAGAAGVDLVARLLAEDNGRRVVMLNPPASQVEVKTTFALLSQALADGALAARAGLTPDELAAIADAVPWTRVLRGAELVAEVAAAPDRFVLKRAWDYGGRAVFVGRARGDAGFHARVQAAWPDVTAEIGWPELCARAAADARGGGFVVQELVDLRPTPHVLCGPDRAEPVQLYVDFSAYASVGLDGDPGWGGVCRGSTSSIVNIMGGGGVVPLITADVASELAAALGAP